MGLSVAVVSLPLMKTEAPLGMEVARRRPVDLRVLVVRSIR